MAMQLRTVAKQTWLTIIRTVLILAILSIGIGAAIVGTEGGRIALVKQVLQLAPLVNAPEITAIGIRSPAVGRWRIAWLTLDGGENQPDLAIDDLVIDWQWLLAFQNRWQFNEIRADRLVVSLPEPTGQNPFNLAQLAEQWPAFPAMRVQRLSLDELRVERPRYPDLVGQLSAQADLNWGVIPARFVAALNSLDGEHHYAAAQLSADQVDQFRLLGTIDAPPRSALSQWLGWTLPEPAKADWNLTLNYQRDGQLGIEVLEFTAPWQNHSLTANGVMNYQLAENRLSFLPFALYLDGQQALLEGELAATQSDLAILVEDWPIEPAAEFLGVSDLSGRLNADGQLFGGWTTPAFDGRLQGIGTWQDQPLSVELDAVNEGSTVTLRTADIQLAEHQLALNGTTNWRSQSMDLAFSGGVTSDTFIRSLLPTALQPLSFNTQVTGTITGTTEAPRITFDSQSTGQWHEDAFDVRVNGQWNGESLVLNESLLYSDLIIAGVNGSWRAETNEWQAEVGVREVRSDILSRFNVRFPVQHSLTAAANLTASGTGSEFDLNGDINVAGRWHDLPANADVSLGSLTRRGIQLDDVRFSLADSSNEMSGEIHWQEKRLDLTLAHAQLPTDIVTTWLGFLPPMFDTLSGELTGITQVAGNWQQPELRTQSEFIGRWFDEPLSFSADVNAADAQNWFVNQLSLQWLEAEWQYRGNFQPYQQQLNGQTSVRGFHSRYLPKLSASFTENETALPDNLVLTLNAEQAIFGALNSPTLQGSAQLNGFWQSQPVDITAELNRLTRDDISVTSATGRWFDGDWSFTGDYHWRDNLLAADITASMPNVSPLKPWIELTGFTDAVTLSSWQGALEADVSLANTTGYWQIAGELDSSGVVLGDLYELSWQGAGNLSQALNHSLAFQMGESEIAGNLMTTASSIDGELTLQDIRYSQLKPLFPAIPKALTGIISGDVRLSGATQNPAFDIALVSVGEVARSPLGTFNASLVATGQFSDWQVEQAIVDFPERLSLTATGAGQAMNGLIELEALAPNTDYWISNAALGTGTARVWLIAEGDLNEPDLTGNLRWRTGTQNVAVEADLTSTDTDYQLSGSWIGDGLTRAKLQSSAERVPLAEWLTSVPDRAFSAALTINTPLDILEPFVLDQPDIAVDGQLSGSLVLSGNALQPDWSGQLVWSEGRFEHSEYGSLIDDIELVLTGSGPALQLTGNATDGQTGSIRLEGDISFLVNAARELAHSINLTTDFNRAELLNQAELNAAASGTLITTGSYHNLLISGTLDLAALSIQSETFLLDGAPQLNIVDTTDDATPVNERPFFWPRGNWDTLLNLNSRGNLYGQGITAELAGSLEISDDLYEPVMAGRFDIVRGFYSGFGKVFTLTGGTVRIQNEQVVLSVQGEYEEDGITYALSITGNQDELKLQLSADVSMDQDELLAQLLFGEVVEDLDIIQAYQLAAVINSARTGDSGGIISATRDELALDSLIINTENDEQGNLAVNVSAGKYLNDVLYLEVEQGVGTEQDFRSSIQYQLSPQTYLELFTQGNFGSFDQNGIELNWEVDY